MPIRNEKRCSVNFLRISHLFSQKVPVPSDVISYVQLVIPCAFNDPAAHVAVT